MHLDHAEAEAVFTAETVSVDDMEQFGGGCYYGYARVVETDYIVVNFSPAGDRIMKPYFHPRLFNIPSKPYTLLTSSPP
jgi:hypothetical protein